MKKLALQGLLYAGLLLLALLIWWPLWFMVMGIFLPGDELSLLLGPALGAGEGYARWFLLPNWPTLEAMAELLLDTPEFFVVFWNSCKVAFPQILGQLLVGAPAAWAFARFRFPGRKALFSLYVVLMLLPFQVTMVPSYLVLNGLNLMDTLWTIILPGIFSTYPVFIMTRSFEAIPTSVIEAAQLDGAGPLQIFLRLGLPMGLPGIISAVVLGFLDAWGAVEQPLVFLETPQRYPLALYLPEIVENNLGLSMAAGFIALMPALLIFLFGQKYLEQGILQGAVKE
ncbi:MAG: carbohydrate ABC transporter permease [Oscillospiraceae bacterium]|nr:carbohydrate ABC transporter permease [Oscillospiraceae bacterium]